VLLLNRVATHPSPSDNRAAPANPRSGAARRLQEKGRRPPRRERRLKPVEDAPGDFAAAVRAAEAAYARTGQMIDAALAYAEHGIPVFPCEVESKVPLARKLEGDDGNAIPQSGGFYRATTDPDQIREWWSVKGWPGQYHQHLIAAPMGPRTGVWCLDVDTGPEHAIDGIPVWEKLQAEHGAVEDGREHLTASDGLHKIFAWDPEHPVGLSAGALPEGIDVKGDKSYIILPPSVRNGKQYRVSRDAEPGPAPPWLYDLIGRAKSISDNRTNAPAAKWDAEPAADPDLLAEAMTWIPNVGDWMFWNGYAMALYRATHGSERGFQIFDAWSQTNVDKYNKHTTRERWREIAGSPPNRTGAWKIFNSATRNGWKAKPTYAPPKFDEVAEARLKIRRLMRRFLGLDLNVYQLASFDQIVTEAMRVATGLGKTTIAEQVIAEVLTTTKQRGGYAVPTHRLGKSIDQHFRDLGVDAMVYYGRLAKDPDNPGKLMCLDPEKVELANRHYQDVQKSCCKDGDVVCPLFDQCSYQQRIRSKPRLWVFAHHMLWHNQPAFGAFDFLMIDETSLNTQLRGVNEPFELPLKRLKRRPSSMNYSAVELERDSLATLLEFQSDDGPLRRDILEGNTDAHEQQECIRNEWNAMPKFELRPNMLLGQYKVDSIPSLSEIKLARHVIAVREELIKMLRDGIDVSGRLQLTQSSRGRGRVVTWRGIAPLVKRMRVRTMLIDATLPALDVLKVSHPNVKIVAEIEAPLPDSVRIRQVLKSPTSSEKLGGREDVKLNAGQIKHLEECQRYTLWRWIATGRGKTVVIAQKNVAEWLRLNLPKEIDVEHYKSIAGLDDYKDARLMILLGRTAPGPEIVEALAATLTGRMPASIVNPDKKIFSWYRQVRRGIRVKGGAGRAVMGDYHPDEMCEHLRWQTNEAELLQAFGRARAVNRGKDTPLDADFLFNVVLSVEVDEVTTWKAPSLYFSTAAEGVCLVSPTDMVKAWPRLFNLRAAERCSAVGIPPLPNYVKVSYQLAGRNMKPRIGYFDLALIPDPRAWLEARLGALRGFSR
jgi:Bifunctional DNA primase/polymerase, N-terminal/Primase C terminal 2 (PriCT-2)